MSYKKIIFILIVLVLVQCVVMTGIVIQRRAAASTEPSPVPSPAPSVTAAPSPAQSTVGSPYEPWPLSFPKMLAGIILLEQQGAEISVTPAQAKTIAPSLHVLGKAWKEVHSAEMDLVPLFNDPQQAYIAEHKHEFERSSFNDRIPQTMGSGGENRTVAAALAVLKKNVKEKGSLRTPTEITGMTVFDASSAIFAMDSLPDLRVTGVQAEKMLTILSRIVKPLKEVQNCTLQLAAALSPQQITWIQSHMAEVTATKRNAFASVQGPYKDPLIWHVILLMESKAVSTGAAPTAVQ